MQEPEQQRLIDGYYRESHVEIKVTHCCVCFPIRCGLITLAVLTMLNFISMSINTIQFYAAGGFDILPLFSVALLVALSVLLFICYF